MSSLSQDPLDENTKTSTVTDDVEAVVYERQGHLDLVPVPSDYLNDPFNWPS